MIFFVLIMGVSFIKVGFPDVSKYYFPMVIFPYVAGRLIPISKIKEFIILVGVLGLFAFSICVFRTFDILEHWKILYGISSTRPILYGSPVNTYLLGLLLGNLLLFTVVFLLSRLATKLIKKAPSYIYISILTVPIISYYFILMGNKTAVISVAVVSVCLLLFSSHVSVKRRLLVFILLALSLFGVFKVMPDNIIQFYKYQKINELIHVFEGKYYGSARLSSQNDDSQLVSENNTLAVRAVLWRSSSKLFLENWVFGIGAGETDRLGIKPHSIIIQAMVELGVVGGGLLVIFYSIVFYRLLKNLIREDMTDSMLWYFMPLLIYYFIYDQSQGNLIRSISSFLVAGIAVSLALSSQSKYSN